MLLQAVNKNLYSGDGGEADEEGLDQATIIVYVVL